MKAPLSYPDIDHKRIAHVLFEDDPLGSGCCEKQALIGKPCIHEQEVSSNNPVKLHFQNKSLMFCP